MISIILLLSVFINGCINGKDGSKENEIRYYQKGDMELIISSDKSSYNLNTSEILITAHLKNIVDEPIKIKEGFEKGWNTEYNLTTPSNNMF